MWRDELSRAIEALQADDFSTRELDAIADEIAARRFPENQSPHPTARRTLQELRDRGEVVFVSPGKYRRASPEMRTKFTRARTAAAAREIARRRAIWSDFLAAHPDRVAPAAYVNAAGMYDAYRGVYVDKKRNTFSEAVPEGIAVGLRHDGRSYADDLSDDGLLYHYPATAQMGRDESEVAAIAAAMELAVPVFVIIGPSSARTREVRLGYVEGQDDKARHFLVTFVPDFVVEDSASADNPLAPGEPPERRLQEVAYRPNQKRFVFDTLRRYGPVCAVCDVARAEVLDAAHLRPKSASGSDDARNGLILCANHHRALDAGLWRLSPDGFVVQMKGGIRPNEIGITRTNLDHLPALPGKSGIEWLWDLGFKPVASARQRRKNDALAPRLKVD